MKDDIAAFDCIPNRITIPQIAGDDFDLLLDVISETINPAVRAGRGIAHESTHLTTLGNQRFDKVTTDKPTGAGDENGFVFEIHAGIMVRFDCSRKSI